MFLFNREDIGTIKELIQFKYIICSYSTMEELLKKYGYRNLNTSYVPIQRKNVCKLCDRLIYLNTSYVPIQLGFALQDKEYLS